MGKLTFLFDLLCFAVFCWKDVERLICLLSKVDRPCAKSKEERFRL